MNALLDASLLCIHLWLRLCFLLGLLVLPFLLLLLRRLLLVFPLQRRLLLLRLFHRLKEALQSCLLCRFDVPLQLLGRTSDSLLIEAFLSDEICDEAFNIRSIPCEIAFFVVCWSYVWIEEELSCFLVGPIVRDSVSLLRVFLD